MFSSYTYLTNVFQYYADNLSGTHEIFQKFMIYGH